MRSVLFFSRPRCEGWPHHGRAVGRLLALPIHIWFDYSNAHLLSEPYRLAAIARLRNAGVLIAKFHYTGPHGLVCGPGLRETPLGPCGSPTKSVLVRSGPVGPV